jgi:hypothetical protein
MFNPVTTFIETDELEAFVAEGGRREVRYEPAGDGREPGCFRFGYTLRGRWFSFTLPDEVNDPSERERLILDLEPTAIKRLRDPRI